jgi:ABC-type antimicrobial peptide transport system permease subunit
MALGGTRTDILKLVVTEAMTVTGVGLALGLVSALALGGFLQVILYGVASTDPLTFVTVSVFMIGITFAACAIPARRAANADPMVALRHE